MGRQVRSHPMEGALHPSHNSSIPLLHACRLLANSYVNEEEHAAQRPHKVFYATHQPDMLRSFTDVDDDLDAVLLRAQLRSGGRPAPAAYRAPAAGAAAAGQPGASQRAKVPNVSCSSTSSSDEDDAWMARPRGAQAAAGREEEAAGPSGRGQRRQGVAASSGGGGRARGGASAAAGRGGRRDGATAGAAAGAAPAEHAGWMRDCVQHPWHWQSFKSRRKLNSQAGGHRWEERGGL